MLIQSSLINKNLTVQPLNLQGHTVLCIDNFLQHPDALVDYACNATFTPYPGFQEKKGYPGVRAAAPENYAADITAFTEPLIKQCFGIPPEKEIRKSMSAMSLVTVPPDQLGPLQRTPHFDASTPYHIAVILYLCNEEHGGTAFYRHKASGLDCITPDTVDPYLDTYYREINQQRPEQHYFVESNQHFLRTGMISAKYNRLVLYKGSLLHNAVINPEKSIDDNPRTGRLTINTFFDF